ncbi:MAG: LysM peptidoglycan-binding domain-containing protein [Rhizomicrobium sp.]
MLEYDEYNAAGYSTLTDNRVYYRTAVYDAVSNVTSDRVTTLRSDGTYVAASTYSYGTPVYHAGTFSYSFDGAYQGVVSQIVTTNTKNGSAQPTSEADYFYDWRDSAVEGTESYTANTAVSAPVANYSGYNYGLGGRLASVVIDDGHPRTITFGTNIEGQILSRAENDNVGGTVDQYERHFYFDGMALGDVSNNGTSDTDYAASIAAHIAVPGSGNLRGGATAAMPYADFDQSYDPVNGITMAGAPSHYTAQDGDTLAGIAAMLWGDASLWYVIADANGLSSPSDSLTAGTDLIVPNKVVNVHNNSTTFKVYDPNEAIGDTAPTVPRPKQDKGCGLLGQVVLAVIAIVVTLVSYGALAGPMSTFAASTLGLDAGVVSSTTAAVAGTAGVVAVGSDAAIAGAVMAGAIGGAAGSIFSQGVGLATGIQNSFNWNAVGLAAIGGAIGGGLGPNALDAFGGATASSFVNAALRGVAGSIVTQGIGVATGLQKKFDWTGVAAAGIGAGVGEFVSGLLPGSATGTPGSAGYQPPSLSNLFLSGMAGDIANAATRTLIDGSDFGDNLIAALPDTIGQTIGNAIAGEVEGSDQLTPAEHESRMNVYNSALNTGAEPDKLAELYHELGLDSVTPGAPPVDHVDVQSLGSISDDVDTITAYEEANGWQVQGLIGSGSDAGSVRATSESAADLGPYNDLVYKTPFTSTQAAAVTMGWVAQQLDPKSEWYANFVQDINTNAVSIVDVVASNSSSGSTSISPTGAYADPWFYDWIGDWHLHPDQQSITSFGFSDRDYQHAWSQQQSQGSDYQSFVTIATNAPNGGNWPTYSLPTNLPLISGLESGALAVVPNAQGSPVVRDSPPINFRSLSATGVNDLQAYSFLLYDRVGNSQTRWIIPGVLDNAKPIVLKGQ